MKASHILTGRWGWQHKQWSSHNESL